jgi:2-dehydropantoate 2-reductase
LSDRGLAASTAAGREHIAGSPAAVSAEINTERMSTMRIDIVGAGAMGSLFGGLLAESGCDVHLVDVWKEHVETINDKGLWIEGLSGDRFIEVRAATEPEEIPGISDLIIFFVKSYHTETAARGMSSLVGKNTTILTLQNGLGNFETLSSIFGEERVVAGTTSHGANVLGPGRVCHAGAGPTVVGELSGLITDRTCELAQVLTRARIETDASDNVLGLIWSKLMVNVGINALGTLLRVRNGELTQGKHSLALQRELVEEALTVAEKKGVTLTHPHMVDEVATVCEKTSGNINSMLQDVLRKRRTEIDSINGAIVREGERLKAPTPTNRIVSEMIRAIEQNYAKQI